MTGPRVYADFQNADAGGRVRLNTVGTARDLAEQGLELSEGLGLLLYSDDADDRGNRDDLVVEGVATYSNEEHCWVARIDWTAIRHASQIPAAPVPGVTFDGHGAITPQSAKRP